MSPFPIHHPLDPFAGAEEVLALQSYAVAGTASDPCVASNVSCLSFPSCASQMSCASNVSNVAAGGGEYVSEPRIS